MTELKSQHQSDKEIKQTRQTLLIIGILIILITIISFYFWRTYLKNQHQQLQIRTGKSLINELKVIRRWVSLQGGIYVPITDDIKPNPYLQDDDKVIMTKDGKRLTKMNSAYLTRMFSEIMKKDSEIKFDLTSLKLINPENKADSWQKKTLKQFKEGKEREMKVIDSNKQSYFRYMEPLLIRKSCLKCHAKQGYKVGDIRGGVSVSFPFEQKILTQNINKIGWWHFFILSGILFLIYLLGIKLMASMQVHKQYKKKLERVANYDGLTNLLNRRSLMNGLQQEFSRAKHSELSLSVIMLDLDHFKRVNDNYGHSCGDVVLEKVAEKMKLESRKNDIVGRFGGEEFLMVLPGAEKTEALQVAKRIRRTIADTVINCEGEEISVTASLGVVELTESVETVDKLIMLADESMYEAKQKGRNRVCKK